MLQRHPAIFNWLYLFSWQVGIYSGTVQWLFFGLGVICWTSWHIWFCLDAFRYAVVWCKIGSSAGSHWLDSCDRTKTLVTGKSKLVHWKKAYSLKFATYIYLSPHAYWVHVYFSGLNLELHELLLWRKTFTPEVCEGMFWASLLTSLLGYHLS